MKRTILQPGYTKPYEQTPIYARVEGYVGEMKKDKNGVPEVNKDGIPIIVSGGVFVDIGDHGETKGKLLAELFVPETGSRTGKQRSPEPSRPRLMVKQAAEEGLKARQGQCRDGQERSRFWKQRRPSTEADAEQMRAGNPNIPRSIKLFAEKGRMTTSNRFWMKTS